MSTWKDRATAAYREALNTKSPDQSTDHLHGDAWEPPEDQNDQGAGDSLACGQKNERQTSNLTVMPWPDPPASEAYHGLTGDVVRVIEPHTEADLVALLLQFLTAFGNMIGRAAHFKVEGDLHYTNLFAVLVGRTSRARKGTSWSRVRRPLMAADLAWVDSHIQSGLSSGEGLIWEVRDAIVKREPIKERGRITSHQEVEVDEGVADKRLLVYEAEFAVVLKSIERQGNILSAILRQAWETGTLRTMVKNSPARASDAHISIIGHITVEELIRYLSTTEAASGFGNRFLWACVKRSKLLPEGGGPVADAEVRTRLCEAVEFAKTVGELRRDEEAAQLWREKYQQLSMDRPGLSGALSARGEAQVVRLACLYALLDKSKMVQVQHLRAALALWDYCERSVRFIFGDSLGDPMADEILYGLRGSPQGLTRDEIRQLVGKNTPSQRIGRALGVLVEYTLARSVKETTAGRPVERWFTVSGDGRKGR